MTTDINIKEKKCFDDLDKNTKEEEVWESTKLLDRIKQEINKVPIELRETWINELSKHTAHVSNTKEFARRIRKLKKHIFGWRRSTELLIQLMLEIHDQVHIFTDRSMVDVFVRMCTSKDLRQESEKIYIACKTNLFGYIVDRLKPYCISFNPASIERCGLFISKPGNKIRACNLYNTTKDNLHERIIIDHIVKKYL